MAASKVNAGISKLNHGGAQVLVNVMSAPGTKVMVQGTHAGMVVGHGFQHTAGGEAVRPLVLVQLEKGFYQEGGEGDARMYITVVVADPAQVKEVR